MSTEDPGQAALWEWFELSHASWLTLPRVLMHSMPDDWQAKMAVLLSEFDAAFPGVPPLETRVQTVENKKFIRQPDWLDYRHPDVDFIDSMRPKNGEGKS